MPTYEYSCKSCSEKLEAVQSFSDAPLTECPACGGDLRKLFGSIGIAFKGSGFYKTDSRTSSGKKGTSEESKPSETKADPKPADAPAATAVKSDTPAPKSTPDSKPAAS